MMGLSMGYVTLIIKLSVIAYILQALYLWSVHMGIGIHYNDVRPGPCKVIPGINCGSEKISVTTNGLAFITNGYKGVTNCNPKYVKSNIYLFDFNHPDENVTKLIIEGDNFNADSFNPLGMDTYQDTINRNLIYLYVVNHGITKHHTIEVFQFNKSNKDHIKHMKTIENENFICLNDIAVISKDRFYVTNFGKACHYPIPFINEIEFLLKLKSASIVYYEKNATKVVASGESQFNGITLSDNHNTLFVILFTSGQLFVYNRNNMTGELSTPTKHFIGFHPDNVFFDQSSGELYVGVHKSIYCFAMMLQNQTQFCPATGIKISTKISDWEKVEIEEIVCQSGKHFVSISSSFVHYKGQYLVGTVFDKLGYCVDKSYNENTSGA